jgi:putative hydrolase of the HAD superfamily
MASNFDTRLRSVVAGLPELAAVGRLVISSEVGWKKPAPAFFQALTAAFELPAAEVLLVGDDLDNDFEGARAAGLPALLLDPAGRSNLAPGLRLERLTDLLGR